ncbi:MAG: hypothetical protein OCC49_09960 [Fibrobacterales bacterium]
MYIKMVFISLLLLSTIYSEQYNSLEDAQIAGTTKQEGDFIYVTIHDTIYTNTCNCDTIINPCPQTNEGSFFQSIEHSIHSNLLTLVSFDAHIKYSATMDSIHTITTEVGTLASRNGWFVLGGYHYGFSKLQDDPWFIGTQLNWAQMDGDYNIGEKMDKLVHIQSYVGTLGIFVGSRTQWKSGFFAEWRVGPSIPYYWEKNYTNYKNHPQTQFEKDVEDYDSILKTMTYVFGGSGLNVGWLF